MTEPLRFRFEVPCSVEHAFTVWEPPNRLDYVWFLRADRADATDVVIRFVPARKSGPLRRCGRGW